MKTITITLLTFVGVVGANTLPPTWENTLPPTYGVAINAKATSLVESPTTFENTLPPSWEMVDNTNLISTING